MADTDNHIIGLIGSSKAPIKVELGEFQGLKTVDIRKHYFDKSTRELKPTTKGIAIGLGNFQELHQLLVSNESTILEWLSGSSVDSNVANAHSDYRNAVEAKESARAAIVPFTVEFTARKGQAFFTSESRGGNDYLELNKSHPFASAINDLEGVENSAKDLLLDMLASFHRAKALFSANSERLTPDEIFDTLEFNWGLYLKKMLVKRGV